jgi:cation diffusion facilitator family transporter
MTDCCEDKSCEVAALKDGHARILKTVLAINAGMFLLEAAAGFWADSTALKADSLDMLGDALAYGVSLYVLRKSEVWNAYAALFKGSLMALFGLLVLAEVIVKILHPSMPVASTIGIMGALAMAANLTCLMLLWKSRGDDLNMHSVWLCSRNDILVNAGVLATALGVKVFQSGWPDILIGLAIAVIVLKSSYGVIHRSILRIR